MWKLIGLFSLLLLGALAFSQQISREFDIKVELTGKLQEEKPRLQPPKNLSLPPVRELNLSSRLLEGPKSMEFAQVKAVEKEGGVSCGEPKDALAYRLGVDYYLKGRYGPAQEELGRVILIPNSPFKPMAEYVLGIIAYSQGERDRALDLFRNSCRLSHMYQKAACEAYYALHLTLRDSLPENQDPLWGAVRALKEGREAKPSCEGVIFSQYCEYVSRFAEGKEHPLYRDSTLLRSSILLYFKGELSRAREVFSSYSAPGKAYRDIALYYLALIDYRQGRSEQAIRHASILETLNKPLAGELYGLLSEKDPYLSRLLYQMTKDTRFLEKAGIIAYNSGDYSLALRNFLEVGNTRYAVYSALRMGDYRRVIGLLKDKRDKDREDYLWLLEALYWSGEDIAGTLSEVAKAFPDLHREYMGWQLFRKGDWMGAVGFFEDHYYKGIALYNLKRYGEVINLLRGRTDQKANLLKARSALMMGDANLARSFLTQNSPEEIYMLGLSYFLEGSYSRAVSLFERVPADSPLRARALLRAGDSYYNLGDAARAKERYYQVLRGFPEAEEARQATLALLDFAGKDLSDDELEKLLQDYMAKEPNPSPEIIYQQASLQARKGRKKEAEKLLLSLIDTPLKFKAILKLAQIEEEVPKRLVLLYKVYREAELQEDRKRAREELIKIYTSLKDTKSLADLLAEGDLQDKVRALGLYMSLGERSPALSLSKELIKSGHRSSEFEKYLVELYKQTGDASLMDYLLKSPDKSLRGEVLYLQGMDLIRKGDRKRALESFVEVSLNHRGEPYYNRAVLEGAKILLEMGARRDASCMLERFDLNRASSEEVSLYSRLRQGLPRCEVK